MDDSEYLLMENQQTMWWYDNLDKLVLQNLNTYSSPNSILDLGCGTGRLLKKAAEFFPDTQITGIDLSNTALEYCEKKHLKSAILQSTGDCLPFRSESFDCLVSLDVLYIRTVREALCLQESWRVLKPGGFLFLNVPAFSFLTSNHDRAVLTRERYTVSLLTNRLKKAHFDIIKATYWNTLLFPVIIFYRWLQKLISPQKKSDLNIQMGFFDKPLKLLLKFERYFLKYISMPFGSSLFVVARKPYEKI